MKKIGDMLGKNLKPKTEKAPPHELSAATELIREAGLFSKKYGRTYWLGKLKRANVSYNEMPGILKEISKMDPKYSKGGRLTNILTERAKQQKNVK